MKGKRKARITDITVHLRRKDGRKVHPSIAAKALWAAHKIAQRGGDVEKELTEWVVVGIDWRTNKKVYHYGPDRVTEIIGAMGGILETVGLDGLRFAIVDQTGKVKS